MDTSVIEIAVQTMIICAKLCAPILIMSLAVGLAVSLFQSVTQIQEVTLTFVPKLIGVGLVLMLGGHWMLAELIGFTNHLFDMVPRLLQSPSLPSCCRATCWPWCGPPPGCSSARRSAPGRCRRW